jgi:Uncharacterised nucleotidyltransferase
MPTPRASTESAARLLLRALAEPSAVRALSEDEWDLLVRVARTAKLLGRLDARLEASDMMKFVPRAAGGQLRSERAAVAYRTKMVWWELDRLARSLAPLRVPVVLLKGAAYLVQGLRCADGRDLSDVDILVPRERLAEVERALVSSGWEATELDPYDDRYYRQWSHELPPFRYAGSMLELDVHHAILPPLGRISPDTGRLMNRALATQQTPFRVLAPEDQVLHTALHLFQDSDCTNRLRELVDADDLIREFSQRAGFWDSLIEQAASHGASRPLWYTVRFAARFLGTPVPEGAQARLCAHAPIRAVGHLMEKLAVAAVMPPDPDRGYPPGARFASRLLLLRSIWLRFPPRLFLLHSLAKSLPWLKAGLVRPQAM